MAADEGRNGKPVFRNLPPSCPTSAGANGRVDRLSATWHASWAGLRNHSSGAGVGQTSALKRKWIERARRAGVRSLYAATLDKIGSSVGVGRRTPDSGASAALKETAMRGVRPV